MTLFEATVSAGIIFIAGMIIASAASTTTVVNKVDVPDVDISWQQRLVHNAINNPYIELAASQPLADPDAQLVEEAGTVPYTPVEDEVDNVSQNTTVAITDATDNSSNNQEDIEDSSDGLDESEDTLDLISAQVKESDLFAESEQTSEHNLAVERNVLEE